MKETILYLDCGSGISGDMTVAALLDLGASRQVLTEALASLPLSGYSIEIKEVFKSGIRACDFHVRLDEEHENHDHDMNYLYGAPPIHTCAEPDSSSHPHSHRKNGHHTHEHRGLKAILPIIRAGNLTENARALSIRIFEILAKAEAQVHGKKPEEVHFHEVGAVDSIVDIVAAAVCLDSLHPDRVIVSPLTEGCGQVRCQHGLIPVPVPAVTAIAASENLSLRITDIPGELVTPTGAAIAAAVRSPGRLPETVRILRTGLGAGKRHYATAGVLRAMLMEAEESPKETGYEADCILSLETNIDDCTGEVLSYTIRELLSAGALDAFAIPVFMKKNRPAYLLKVLCTEEKRQALEQILFENTSTIGIRRQKMERTKLARTQLSLDTPWGPAMFKVCRLTRENRYYPENDSVSRLARENRIGFSEMYGLLQAYARSASPQSF